MEQPPNGLQAKKNPESSYFVDAKNAAEIARLTKQGGVLTHNLGLLPPHIQLSQNSHILDIACGPGEWIIEMAKKFPACLVTGVDNSEPMLNYARFTAEYYDLTNIAVQMMDVRQPLSFPDASFDLVNARFIVGFMTVAIWPLFLRECLRLLRPGGVLIVTEPESLGSTTSFSFARYNLLMMQAMRQLGQCFSPEGDQFGTVAVLPNLFQEIGFQDIQQEAFVINFSIGTPAYEATFENIRTLMKLLQPLILSKGLVTQEELNVLYARAIEDWRSRDFRAAAFFHRTSGKKRMYPDE